MNHTTVVTPSYHRPGVTYYRVACSCGWYCRSAIRGEALANDLANAHATTASPSTDLTN